MEKGFFEPRFRLFTTIRILYSRIAHLSWLNLFAQLDIVCSVSKCTLLAIARCWQPSCKLLPTLTMGKLLSRADCSRGTCKLSETDTAKPHVLQTKTTCTRTPFSRYLSTLSDGYWEARLLPNAPHKWASKKDFFFTYCRNVGFDSFLWSSPSTCLLTGSPGIQYN